MGVEAIDARQRRPTRLNSVGDAVEVAFSRSVHRDVLRTQPLEPQTALAPRFTRRETKDPYPSRSQTTTLPVSLPAAAINPSGLNAIDRIRPMSQVNVCASCPDAAS